MDEEDDEDVDEEDDDDEDDEESYLGLCKSRSAGHPLPPYVSGGHQGEYQSLHPRPVFYSSHHGFRITL